MNTKPQYEIIHGTTEDTDGFQKRLNAFISQSSVNLLEKPGVTVHFHAESSTWHYMALVVYSKTFAPELSILQPRIIGVQ